MKNNKNFNCDRFKTGYLDESGDSGESGSKSLVLTYICTDEGKKLSKILKKAKEQLRMTKKGERWLNRLGGEIKFSGFPDERIRLKLLEDLSKIELNIRFIAIKKEGKNISESEKEKILSDLLNDSFVHHKCLPSKIIADKDYFKNKKISSLVVKNYEEIVYDEGKSKKMSYESYLAEDGQDLSSCDLVIPIKHENSKLKVELQVVDLISGAIFQEIENEDKTYTEILRKNIKLQGTIKKPTEK
jgi:hypothetical protein